MALNTSGNGIKSLNDRLVQIEESINIEKPNNFIEKMVILKRKREHSKKVNDYQQMINIYIDDVNKWINGLDPFKMIAKIVEITVIFVEKYAEKIAYLIELVFDQDFSKSSYKLNFAIELINMIVPIDVEMIKNMINVFVDILFPKKNIMIEEQINDVRQKKNKKRKKSIFSTWKDIL